MNALESAVADSADRQAQEFFDCVEDKVSHV